MPSRASRGRTSSRLIRARFTRGSSGAQSIGPRVRARASHPLDELRINEFAERAARETEHTQERRREQRARLGGTRRRRERTPAPKYREARFGDEGAIALAELAVAAEVTGQRLVSRAGEAQELAQRRLGVSEHRAGDLHCEMRVASCS